MTKTQVVATSGDVSVSYGYDSNGRVIFVYIDQGEDSIEMPIEQYNELMLDLTR